MMSGELGVRETLYIYFFLLRQAKIIKVLGWSLCFCKNHETFHENPTRPSFSEGKETGLKNSNSTVMGAHCQACTSLMSDWLCKQASMENSFIRWRETELRALLGHGPFRYQLGFFCLFFVFLFWGCVFFLASGKITHFSSELIFLFFFKLYILWSVQTSKHLSRLCS